MTASRRRTLAGVLLALMLLASIAHGLGFGIPAWVAGVAAWVAAALLWRVLGVGQRRQCAVLVGVGLAGVALGAAGGGSVDWVGLLAKNESILALIAGVSFVHLASPGDRRHEPTPPRGAGAMLRTLLGLNLLAAAINITALVLVSDRIGRARALGPIEGATLSRAFSLAVLYSPFIGGMALALNQAPEASLARVALVGVALALAGILLTWMLARWRTPETVADFVGYPMRRDVLWLPAVLAAAVIAWRVAWPAVPILTAIALLAPLVSWGALAARIGPARASLGVASHVGTRLPGMSGELALFLAAGVLAVGLASAFDVAGIALPVDRFGGGVAAAALAAVVIAGAAGLHPIVSLTALVPLLVPLGPPPEALVLLFVAGWSLGCTLCPYSGTNLVLHGRHGLAAWGFPAWSAGYALAMWAIASAVLTALSGGL